MYGTFLITLLLLSTLTAGASDRPQRVRNPYDCKSRHQCALVSEVFALDKSLERGVNQLLSDAALRLPWVPQGTEVGMLPIKLNGRPALIGMVCEPHNCPHQIVILHLPGTHARQYALYIDPMGFPRWLGNPTDAVRDLILQYRGRNVEPGQQFTFNEPAPVTRARYLDRLRSQYLDRITFDSEFSRRRMAESLLDCPARDRRNLPLLNVLLATIAAGDKPRIKVNIDVRSTGHVTRVYHVFRPFDQAPWENLALEINERGQLRTHGGIQIEDIHNACFGTYGPIWEQPAK